MASSTLIIGIGTTGLNIIEACQQYHYEFTQKNKPGNNVEYLYIETDGSKKPKGTPAGKKDIDALHITVNNVQALYNTFKNDNNIDSDWMFSINQLLAIEDGAGGIPSYGRFALWANIQAFQNKLIDKYGAIDGSDDTKIIVVGTLTGGTGTGTCVDMGYLIQHFLHISKSEAIFLLPSQSVTDNIIAQNVTSTISSLNYYNNPENEYNCHYYHIGKVSSKKPPYKVITYLSPDFNDGTASISLNELIKSAGLRVCMAILDTNIPSVNDFEGSLDARRVDSIANSRLFVNNTSSLKLIEYPKSRLIEYVSIEKSIKIMNSLIDSSTYHDKNDDPKQIKSLGNNIVNDTKKWVEDSLSKIMDNMIEQMSINEEVEKLMKNNIANQTPAGYMYRLFQTGADANYYSNFKNNKITTRNFIIDEVSDFIKSKLEEYGNLNVVKKYLETIISEFERIVQFWNEKYKIDGNDALWDSKIQSLVKYAFDYEISKYSIIIQKENYLRYKMDYFLKLSFFHNTISVLKNICESISSNDGLSSLKNKLITISEVDSRIRKISNIIKHDVSKITLDGRKNEIFSELSLSSNVFYKIYSKDSLKNELDQINTDINNHPGASGIKISLITSGTKLWDYLDNNEEKIYQDCIDKIVVQVNQYVKQVTVFQALTSLSNGHNVPRISQILAGTHAQIKNKLQPMCRLITDKMFEHDACAKLIFVSSNKNSLQNLFKNQDLDANAQTQTVELPSISEAFVLYQEYNYLGQMNGANLTFNPIEDLALVQNTYKTIVLDIVNANSQKFQSERLPYIKIEEFKKICNLK